MAGLILDPRSLVVLNLAAQVVLIAALAAATYLARNKKFKQHCKVTRAAFLAQVVLVLGIMLAPMEVYLNQPALYWEVLAHHSLGLVTLALLIYINLVFMRKIKPVHLKNSLAMRLCLAAWVAALVLGLHMYARIYA
ncbi:MAG TPA: hypothetical protein VN455_03900 [Methanotrichaceae archaeon]|nr:hypothetical protein [Methanotrichaceae archaeon]